MASSGKIAPDEHNLREGLAVSPRIKHVAHGKHVHALEDDSAVGAAQIENALVAKHVLTVDARERSDVAFELHRIERSIGLIHKRVDVVVVMVHVMIVVEERRINIKHVVHVEARDVKHFVNRAFAMLTRRIGARAFI